MTAGAVIAAVLGGVLLGKSKADVPGEWGKALVTLFVAILISGLLTFILSGYSQIQQQEQMSVLGTSSSKQMSVLGSSGSTQLIGNGLLTG
jgi:hypothetical protein